MQHPKRNYFALGFLAALALVWGVWVIQNLGFKGGHISNSPSGQYTLRLFSPLSPKGGGSYEIQVLRQPGDQLVQRLEITMPRSKKTVAVRGGHAEVNWDAAGTHADVFLNDDFLVRVSLPSADAR